MLPKRFNFPLQVETTSGSSNVNFAGTNTIGNIITTSSGNVGIGTTAPNSLLDVNGGIAGTSLISSLGNFNNLTSTNITSASLTSSLGNFINLTSNLITATTYTGSNLQIINSTLGALMVNGNVDSNSQFLGQANDTQTSPSFSWTGNTNTGLYRPLTNVLGFSTGGVERMRIDNVGLVSMGNLRVATTATVGTLRGTTVNVTGTVSGNSGSFNSITSNGGTINTGSLSASGTVSGNSGSFNSITSNSGSFNNITSITSNGTMDIRNINTINLLASGTIGGALLEINGFENYRLADMGTYKMIQSYKNQPLSINPLGNNVGIGTSSPTSRLTVNGSFNVTGTKNFEIPHPVPIKKEKGYKLRHSVLETPSRGDNVYRYRIQTIKCFAELLLPDYFHYLNENIQIWCCPIKHFGSGYGEIIGNKLIVYSNIDGDYNILIIGTRKDPDALEFDEKGIEWL